MRFSRAWKESEHIPPKRLLRFTTPTTRRHMPQEDSEINIVTCRLIAE
jgi:hypothetical protein